MAALCPYGPAEQQHEVCFHTIFSHAKMRHPAGKRSTCTGVAGELRVNSSGSRTDSSSHSTTDKKETGETAMGERFKARLFDQLHFGMKLNESKTQINTYSRKTHSINFKYPVNNTVLQRKQRTKDLGILLDSKLYVHRHVHNLLTTANRTIDLIKYLTLSTSNYDSLQCLYYTLVRSILEYCSVVWNSITNADSNRIEKIQQKYFLTKKTWRWVCPAVVNRLLQSASGNMNKVGTFQLDCNSSGVRYLNYEHGANVNIIDLTGSSRDSRTASVGRTQAGHFDTTSPARTTTGFDYKGSSKSRCRKMGGVCVTMLCGLRAARGQAAADGEKPLQLWTQGASSAYIIRRKQSDVWRGSAYVASHYQFSPLTGRSDGNVCSGARAEDCGIKAPSAILESVILDDFTAAILDDATAAILNSTIIRKQCFGETKGGGVGSAREGGGEGSFACRHLCVTVARVRLSIELAWNSARDEAISRAFAAWWSDIDTIALKTLDRATRKKFHSSKPDRKMLELTKRLCRKETELLEQSEYGAALECKVKGKWEMPEKTRRPASSSGKIPTCENLGGGPSGNRSRGE
ncbi:hypothetical protein PR048_029370 [Dryococelus australis]|uniref:Alkylated DNA repair protein AlkB homologue 8 N-terminal domain-containing protein n=1 Tax=Dryococelus australis TaxID=614101 RepID=A0ABQ9GD52_9NEOP|nr:hypothetical protein PR048_029370 [Dryococelus australis]